MIQRLEGVDQAKFILILGVVLGHICFPDWLPASADDMNVGVLGIRSLVHLILNRSVVPLFFVISGMLYFHGMGRLTLRIYWHKTRSRIRTLLVPYLVWNTLCLLLMWAEWRWCGGPGGGVWSERGVDWKELALIYWASPAMGGLPCAYAFWFLRNLMVFVLLSPLAWVIGRSGLVTLVVVLACVLMGSSYWYFLWFVIGAWMGLHGLRIPRLQSSWMYLVWVPAMLYFAYVAREAEGSMWVAGMALVTLMAGVCVRWLASMLYARMDVLLISTCVSATFIIYGFHQMVARPVTQWWMTVTGYATLPAALATYLASFVTIVALSVALYILLRRYAPHLLRLLTGGRDTILP